MRSSGIPLETEIFEAVQGETKFRTTCQIVLSKRGDSSRTCLWHVSYCQLNAFKLWLGSKPAAPVVTGTVYGLLAKPFHNSCLVIHTSQVHAQVLGRPSLHVRQSFGVVLPTSQHTRPMTGRYPLRQGHGSTRHKVKKVPHSCLQMPALHEREVL